MTSVVDMARDWNLFTEGNNSEVVCEQVREATFRLDNVEWRTERGRDSTYEINRGAGWGISEIMMGSYKVIGVTDFEAGFYVDVGNRENIQDGK